MGWGYISKEKKKKKEKEKAKAIKKKKERKNIKFCDVLILSVSRKKPFKRGKN